MATQTGKGSRTSRASRQLTEEWREKIKTSLLINRLGECAFGNVEMTSQQIKAAEILLKKVIPDLKSIDMTSDITLNKSNIKELSDDELHAIATGSGERASD